MKRLAFMLALVGLLSGTSPAAIEPTRTEIRPYAGYNNPPEATAAAAGGLGVVAISEVKSRVQILFSGGAPCGTPRREPDPKPVNSGGNPGGPNTEPDGTGLWLPVSLGAAAVAGLAVVGYLLLRRSQA